MTEGFFGVTCDNCNRQAPLLYAFRFFGRDWHICAPCCAGLRAIMRHKAPQQPAPEIPARQRRIAAS